MVVRIYFKDGIPGVLFPFSRSLIVSSGGIFLGSGSNRISLSDI